MFKDLPEIKESSKTFDLIQFWGDIQRFKRNNERLLNVVDCKLSVDHFFGNSSFFFKSFQISVLLQTVVKCEL